MIASAARALTMLALPASRWRSVRGIVLAIKRMRSMCAFHFGVILRFRRFSVRVTNLQFSGL